MEFRWICGARVSEAASGAGKHAGQQDAFRMSGSESWMNAPINFVESFDNIMAEDQQFFVGRQGHGSVSPFKGFIDLPPYLRIARPAPRDQQA
ncbi:MAG: hypothetical protein ACREE9_06625 [Stellaceae bacterium]